MKDLLPIGSVVVLNEGKKSLMIIGAYQISDSDKNYDYVSVLYPEGHINKDSFFLFNHEDIKEVKFLGFVNAEYQSFVGLLKKQLNESKG